LEGHFKFSILFAIVTFLGIIKAINIFSKQKLVKKFALKGIKIYRAGKDFFQFKTIILKMTNKFCTSEKL